MPFAARSGASASKPTSTTMGRWRGSSPQALEAAARRGVHVNLVVDSVGASGMRSKDMKRLEAAGCHIGSFNSLKWYNLEEVNYRTHRKILDRRRTNRIHRWRRRSPITGSGTRRTRITGVTHKSACAVQSCGWPRQRSTRTSSKPTARSRRSSMTRRARSRMWGTRWPYAARRPAAAAISSDCICWASPRHDGRSTSPRRTSSPMNRATGRCRTR